MLVRLRCYTWNVAQPPRQGTRSAVQRFKGNDGPVVIALGGAGGAFKAQDGSIRRKITETRVRE